MRWISNFFKKKKVGDECKGFRMNAQKMAGQNTYLCPSWHGPLNHVVCLPHSWQCRCRQRLMFFDTSANSSKSPSICLSKLDLDVYLGVVHIGLTQLRLKAWECLIFMSNPEWQFVSLTVPFGSTFFSSQFSTALIESSGICLSACLPVFRRGESLLQQAGLKFGFKIWLWRRLPEGNWMEKSEQQQQIKIAKGVRTISSRSIDLKLGNPVSLSLVLPLAARLIYSFQSGQN